MTTALDPKRFQHLSAAALERAESAIAARDDERVDVELAGDVLTIAFADGTRYIVNAHSAAGQIWMAAERSAWHFDWDEPSASWISRRTGEEFQRTLTGVVDARLGRTGTP